MRMSPLGVVVAGLGAVVGIVIWVVGYFMLPNADTHRDLSRNPAIQTSVNQTSSASSSGSSSQSLPVIKQIPASSIHFTDTSMPGYKVFESQCATCHGQKGEGKIGPAVYGIGKYWNEQQLVNYIHNPAQGMPKNGGLSSNTEVQQVAEWLVKQANSGSASATHS